ncbi:MAG: FGLLP motif-containing membrane protein [Candidatus Limnocylindria bacterium]
MGGTVEGRTVTAARLVLAVALVALISAFLNPDLSFSLEGLAVYLGFLLAIGIVLISFELPGLIVHRRVAKETGRLRVLPWAIVIAAVFVLVSRLVQLQPGYLYGVVLGVIFLKAVSQRDEGREAAAGAAWTLLVAVAAWWGLGWIRELGLPADDLVVIGLETALAAVVVAGLEAVAFGLMPFQFMPGWVIYRWRRPVWAVLFGLSVFAFIHILVGPNSGYLSELSISALMAALGVFAIFGAFSILFWAYFRFRPARHEEQAQG